MPRLNLCAYSSVVGNTIHVSLYDLFTLHPGKDWSQVAKYAYASTVSQHFNCSLSISLGCLGGFPIYCCVSQLITLYISMNTLIQAVYWFFGPSFWSEVLFVFLARVMSHGLFLISIFITRAAVNVSTITPLWRSQNIWTCALFCIFRILNLIFTGLVVLAELASPAFPYVCIVRVQREIWLTWREERCVIRTDILPICVRYEWLNVGFVIVVEHIFQACKCSLDRWPSYSWYRVCDKVNVCYKYFSLLTASLRFQFTLIAQLIRSPKMLWRGSGTMPSRSYLIKGL